MFYNLIIIGNTKKTNNPHKLYLTKIQSILSDVSNIKFVKNCKFENGYSYGDTFEYFVTIEKHDYDNSDKYIKLFISKFNESINNINDSNIFNVKIEVNTK